MHAQVNKIRCYLQGIIKPVEFAYANTGPKFREKKINPMVKPTGGRFFRPALMPVQKIFQRLRWSPQTIYSARPDYKRANYEWGPGSERAIHKYNTGIAGISEIRLFSQTG